METAIEILQDRIIYLTGQIVLIQKEDIAEISKNVVIKGWGKEIEALVKACSILDVLNTLLCDDNIEKMACEYTESESEYQAFILACQVIAEKMQL